GSDPYPPADTSHRTRVKPIQQPEHDHARPRASRRGYATSFPECDARHSCVRSKKPGRTDRLEVCREFQRGNCKRLENECRFAHPPEHVTVDATDGMVTVCMDFVKGRCTREQCRYFHPPPHLQAQLKAVQSRANAAAMPQVVNVIGGKKRPRDTEDLLLQATFPGMVQYTKRPAGDKSGVPVYQPGGATYQTAIASMPYQQPYIPVSFADTSSVPANF
ncbi:PREDICTED: muscleblind-like protein 2a, partial [Priapulus caudatus]|uniref:Muscleblind-like protein 2a n=1 Tax=Priapulus caudatus TaxID=37621 RepID=A0ABM1EZV3_PRICU